MSPKNSLVSSVVIARNEGTRIGECLRALSWCNEMVVIDNGSTDETVTLAKKHGARVVSAKEMNFSELRNRGKEETHGEWILYVDADEIVTPALRDEIQGLVRLFDRVTFAQSYFIKRKNIYLGHLWPYQDKMKRLFWRNALTRWNGELHETATVTGSVGTLQNPLIHTTHRTLEEMVAKTNEWSKIEAKLRLDAQHPTVVPWRLLRVMATAFFDPFIRQGGWRAGTIGWIESIYQAFSIFITYAKLWELQNKDTKTVRH